MKRLICTVLLSLAALAMPAVADVYSAFGDFPTGIQNTQQVWSYGYFTPIAPTTFVQDTTYTSDYFSDGGNAAGYYTPSGGYHLPTVLKNTSGAPLTEGSISNWPTSLLLMHPGPTGDSSVIQFTAPVSSYYLVSGQFTPLDSGSTYDTIFKEGAKVWGPTLSNSPTQPHTFSETLFLAKNQTLDFAVGLGLNGQFYNDSTGFNASIASTATPEPGFYAALAIGLVGLLTMAMSRRRTSKALSN